MDASTKQKLYGVVKNLKLERGFFFIESHWSGAPTDVFCHVTQILPGFPKPGMDDGILFLLSVDSRTGRTQAVEIEVYSREGNASKAGA